jgi:LmbE family N-acetylglucosaminyl deacetylase
MIPVWASSQTWTSWASRYWTSIEHPKFDTSFFPEFLEEGLSPHAVNKIYFFGTADPNTWIDIGETIEAKIEALRAHKSQVGEFEDLSAWVRDRFGQLGKEKRVADAEAFRQLVIP